MGHVRTPFTEDPRDTGSTQARFATLRGLDVPHPSPLIEHLTPLSPRHRRYTLRMPSVTDNNQPDQAVTATYYEVTGAQTPRPLVVVLPIWGSSRFPPRKVVHWLTAEARPYPANVLWIHGEERLIDWPAAEDVETEAELVAVIDRWVESLAGSVVDIRRLIAWSHTRPEVARNQVGIVGFSIGALIGSVVAGTDDRVAGGVFVAGGANLHQILASCPGNTERFRRLMEARLGWSAQRLENWLEPRLMSVNPTQYASPIDPRRMLIIDARKDRCIPETARDDLWNAMGRPERISLGYGHKTSFLTMTFLGQHMTTHEIIDFLDRSLLSPLPQSGEDRRRRDPSARTVSSTPDRENE